MIRIAQAASSETGTAYGTPPNQLRTPGKLDGELNVIPFYASGWRAVFRAKDPQIGAKIGDLAYKVVEAGDKVGYGQQTTGASARTGLFDALNGMAVPNPAKIPVPVNCDCSSMAGACAYYAGAYHPDLRTMNTTTAPTRLLESGYFVRVEDADLLEAARGCKRGDLFWRPGHMMICLDSDGEQPTEPRRIWNCSACNLRSGPSTDYNIVGVLHGGDLVTLISTASTGWGQVHSEAGVGFVSPKYLTKLEIGKATGNVWMRENAGTQYAQIMVVPQGAEVYLTGEWQMVGYRKWYEVIYAGRQGWCSSLYLAT